MKILLIHPNRYAQRYVSVGIGMISAVLKAAGHEVMYFDTSRFREDTPDNSAGHVLERQTGKMEEVLQFVPVELPAIRKSVNSVNDALHETISAFRPGLIGLSVTSSDFAYAVLLIEQIKRYRIPTIIGGSQCIAAPLETLSVEGVDMVCVSEGEEAVVELAGSLEAGQDRTDIRNIYFKKGNRTIRNGIRPYADLNSLPFTDLDIFDTYHHLGAYQGGQVMYGRFEIGRGCPYTCSYCINGKLHKLHESEKRHVRYKTPERIIKELRYGLDKIRCDIFRFVDETFTAMPEDYLSEFVGLYRRDIRKPMVIATRPEMVSRRKMEILRGAHDDIQVTMGIESGSEKIRKNVCNRHMSNGTIIEAFRLCKKMGFHTASFNMIGLPGETREDFLQTIRINREAEVDTPMLSFFYPFPGTRLRGHCVEKGYIDDVIHEVDYAVYSVLRMPQFPVEEMEGLKRTFVLYVKMNEEYYPDIFRAEKDDSVFHALVSKYNEDYYCNLTQLSN